MALLSSPPTILPWTSLRSYWMQRTTRPCRPLLQSFPGVAHPPLRRSRGHRLLLPVFRPTAQHSSENGIACISNEHHGTLPDSDVSLSAGNLLLSLTNRPGFSSVHWQEIMLFGLVLQTK